MVSAIGIDIFVDGIVLGLSFVAGAKAGLLLTIALTLEVLFLGLTVRAELGEILGSKVKVVGAPVASLPPRIIGGFLTFGLMALLYLVTEELLVEAHKKPDGPVSAPCFSWAFSACFWSRKRLTKSPIGNSA
jgi:zinc transporter, ZIP family